MANAKQLATGLLLYAKDLEGAYPLDLSELVPDYISDLEPLRFVEVSSSGNSGRYDWLYFNSGHDEKHASRLMVASPQAPRAEYPNKRIVAYSDGSAAIVPEKRYQTELHLMIEAMRKAAASTSNSPRL